MRVLFFYFTIFISGAAVLVIEIGGTRVLTPFYGSTIYVWSSLISVTMIFLALGYVVGGALADRHPPTRTIWAILFFAGLATYAIPEYDQLVLPFTDHLGIRWAPLAASFLLFAPSLTLLGMVAPLAVKLRAQTLQNLGTTAGNLYALATFGSLAGALATGFYLTPNFPFTIIFRLLGIILMLLFIVWQMLIFRTSSPVSYKKL